MNIQNIDIYATIPGAGEQIWTIYASDVRKECVKIQECVKEGRLYQTDNVIMSADPSFNACQHCRDNSWSSMCALVQLSAWRKGI